MRRLFLLCIGLFVIFNVQANEVDNLKSSAEKYFAVVKVFDTTAMSNMLHPDALSEFRRTFDQVFTGGQSEKAKTDILPLFSVTKIEEFDALSDRMSYQRFNDFIISMQPQLLTMMKASSSTIKTVSIVDGIGFVNYTLTMNVKGQSIDTDAVQKFKLDDGTWLALLPASSNASMEGIKAQYK